jgi:exosortase A-associated hydrolase 1
MTETSERAIVFRCEADSLLGILHTPAHGAARIGVLVVVGGPQYRVGSHRQFVLMSRALARAGFAVFRFDYRGMGDSEGEPHTFEDIHADIRAALDAFCAEHPNLDGIVLWGLCDAASATLLFGAHERLRGLILANPWVRTVQGEARAYLKHYYLQRLLQSGFWRKVAAGAFNPVRAARELLDTVGTTRRSGAPGGAGPGSFVTRMLTGLRRFDGPVLLLVSERDLVAREFLDLCARENQWQAAISSARVRVRHLSGADHTFSSRAALELATETCIHWLSELSAAAQPRASTAARGQ